MTTYDAKVDADFGFVREHAAKYGFDEYKAFHYFRDCKAYYFPDVKRATSEQKATAAERIREWVESLRGGQRVEVKEGAQVAGLDPDNRSHQDTVRKAIIATGLVEFTPASREGYIKRLTNGASAAN